MSAWFAVSSVARPHIAVYLDDLTPFAAAHSVVRCCSHFEKYMTCTDTGFFTPFTPFTKDSCAKCLAVFACRVTRHRHIQCGRGICGLLYVGGALCTEDCTTRPCSGSTETSYLWVPSRGAVLCNNCCQNTEETAAFLEKLKSRRVEFEDEPYYDTQEWSRQYAG